MLLRATTVLQTTPPGLHPARVKSPDIGVAVDAECPESARPDGGGVSKAADPAGDGRRSRRFIPLAQDRGLPARSSARGGPQGLVPGYPGSPGRWPTRRDDEMSKG